MVRLLSCKWCKVVWISSCEINFDYWELSLEEARNSSFSIYIIFARILEVDLNTHYTKPIIYSKTILIQIIQTTYKNKNHFHLKISKNKPLDIQLIFYQNMIKIHSNKNQFSQNQSSQSHNPAHLFILVLPLVRYRPNIVKHNGHKKMLLPLNLFLIRRKPARRMRSSKFKIAFFDLTFQNCI